MVLCIYLKRIRKRGIRIYRKLVIHVPDRGRERVYGTLCMGKKTCNAEYLCYNVGDNRIVRGLLIEEERNIS